ncbi:MAG: hypothetical protein E6G97_23515 [Alphaproteobacteria bacterium]|nr:MAG: hypothetical protein E6G97_23515 [Alphaproteobacteria bacterium]
MKKLLISTLAIVVLAGCKGGVPQQQAEGNETLARVAAAESAQSHQMAAALCQDAKKYTAASRQRVQPGMDLPALRQFAEICTNPPSADLAYLCAFNGGYFEGDCASNVFSAWWNGWPLCSRVRKFCGSLGGTFY